MFHCWSTFTMYKRFRHLRQDTLKWRLKCLQTHSFSESCSQLCYIETFFHPCSLSLSLSFSLSLTHSHTHWLGFSLAHIKHTLNLPLTSTDMCSLPHTHFHWFNNLTHPHRHAGHRARRERHDADGPRGCRPSRHSSHSDGTMDSLRRHWIPLERRQKRVRNKWSHHQVRW